MPHTTIELSIRRVPDGTLRADARLTSTASAAATTLADDVPVTVDPDALRTLELDPAAYGALLSEHLFAEPRLRNAWLQSRAYAVTGTLQFRLRLPAADPALHALRWETLRDPET